MWQYLLASEAVKQKGKMASKLNAQNSAGIPAWARGIIIIIILLVIIFIAYKLYKYISDRQGFSDREDIRDTQSDLNDLIKKGVKPSYNQSQYSSWASALRQSFDGCGTGNSVWENIFKALKNDADVLALNATYGTRTYDGCNWEGDYGDKTGTLAAALNDELSSSEISKINSMLSSKNIKFQY